MSEPVKGRHQLIMSVDGIESKDSPDYNFYESFRKVLKKRMKNWDESSSDSHLRTLMGNFINLLSIIESLEDQVYKENTMESAFYTYPTGSIRNIGRSISLMNSDQIRLDFPDNKNDGQFDVIIDPISPIVWRHVVHGTEYFAVRVVIGPRDRCLLFEQLNGLLPRHLNQLLEADLRIEKPKRRVTLVPKDVLDLHGLLITGSNQLEVLVPEENKLPGNRATPIVS